MAAAEVSEAVRAVLASNVAPALVLEVPSERIVAASAAAADLLSGGAEITGRSLEEFAVDHPTGALPLLTAGRINGYEAVRELRRADGPAQQMRVWLRRLGSDQPPRLALAVLCPNIEPPAVPAPADAPDDSLSPVVGTTDESLFIERISRDIHGFLGYQPSEVVGESILRLFTADSGPAVLWALAQAGSSRVGVSVRLDARAANGSVVACQALIVAMLPATSFGFALLPGEEGFEPATQANDMREAVWRLSRGSRAVVTFRDAMAAMPDPGLLSALTSRELEVVLRLLAGDRVPEIARSLYLAPGTVRNHLASVYKRLGVSSQQELISLLRGNDDAKGNP